MNVKTDRVMQKVITETIGGKRIILLQGDVDTSDQRLSRRLQSIRQQEKECHVWVDCGSIACIRLLGMCHFINQLLMLRDQKTHVLLVQPEEHLKKALALCRVDSFFTFTPSLEQAYLGV